MWLMVHRNIVKLKITDDMRTIGILLTYLAMLPFTACSNSESDLNAEQQELETEQAEIEKEQEELLVPTSSKPTLWRTHLKLT